MITINIDIQNRSAVLLYLLMELSAMKDWNININAKVGNPHWEHYPEKTARFFELDVVNGFISWKCVDELEPEDDYQIVETIEEADDILAFIRANNATFQSEWINGPDTDPEDQFAPLVKSSVRLEITQNAKPGEWAFIHITGDTYDWIKQPELPKIKPPIAPSYPKYEKTDWDYPYIYGKDKNGWIIPKGWKSSNSAWYAPAGVSPGSGKYEDTKAAIETAAAMVEKINISVKSQIDKQIIEQLQNIGAISPEGVILKKE